MNITKKFIDRHIQDFDPSYEYWNDEEIEKKKLFYDINALEQSDEQQFFIKEINQLISEDKKEKIRREIVQTFSFESDMKNCWKLFNGGKISETNINVKNIK